MPLRGGWERGGVPTPRGTLWRFAGSGGGAPRISAAQSPWEACWAPGPGPLISRTPSGFMGPRRVGGRREEKEERQTVGGDPPGPEDQGRRGGRFPHPLGPGKLAGLPGRIPNPPRPPLGRNDPTGIRGRWGEKRRDGQWRGTLQNRGIRGSALGISPAHSALGSLLGLRVWSPAFWGPLQPQGS